LALKRTTTVVVPTPGLAASPIFGVPPNPVAAQNIR
jgi:hypothetical protein